MRAPLSKEVNSITESNMLEHSTLLTLLDSVSKDTKSCSLYTGIIS